jgi:outer membrane biosynthesis protein TonB
MQLKPLGYSMALHILIIGLLWQASPHVFNPEGKDTLTLSKVLEMRSITEAELEEEIQARMRMEEKRQIVQSDEQLKREAPLKDTKEQVFLSRHNQQVDKNTRAPRVGAFKNVLEEGATTESANEEKKAVTEKSKTKKVSAAEGIFSMANDYSAARDIIEDVTQEEAKSRQPSSILESAESLAAKKGQGLSATDDFLEGIAIGPNTLLNTQEFKYYSFYERVREKLVERWRNRIRKEISKTRTPASIHRHGTLPVGSKITKLRVYMDQSGDIQRIEKLGISGVEAFDQAAIMSFHEAAPFPHPPAEMLKEGLLMINWDFVVLVEEATGLQFKVTQSI